MSSKDNSNIQDSIIPGVDSYSSCADFLVKHNVNKTNGGNKKTSTNTRIGDKTKSVTGGNYHISDIEYPTFLELYKRDIVLKNKKEYLTEKQMEEGPLVVDLDFRYDYNVDEKQHTSAHIEDLITLYNDELKKIFQYDDDTKYEVYIFEKPSVNRVKDKDMTKDGIHILFSLQCDRYVQQLLRKEILKKIGELWSDLPLKNRWEDVLDEGISKGTTNWQLYGSRKPGNEKYSLIKIFETTYDDTDGEICLTEKVVSKFNMEKDFHKLSVRNKEGNTVLFMRNDFMERYNAFKGTNVKSPRPANNTNSNLNNTFRQSTDNSIIARIRNKDELELAVDSFLDSVSNNSEEYDLKTMHQYAMILPQEYYGSGSYDKWIRVAFALKNTNERLLITWIAFSAKYEHFDYNTIPELCEKWENFENKGKDGLTKLSLLHWARKAAPEAFDEINRDSLDFYIENCVNGNNSKYIAPDNDIAKIVYNRLKHEYVCIGIKNNIWYKYKNNSWKEDESGVSLRKALSHEIRDLVQTKAVETNFNVVSNRRLLSQIAQNEHDDNEQENEVNKTRTIQLLGIARRLGSTADKQKIMTECKELFYDGTFMEKLDENKYLLCCKNGVIDFKEKIFRPGVPEDYISLSTNIKYIQLTPKHDKIKREILKFMRELFPEEEVCKYMWEHLASTLIGTSPNQTFNMYHGGGQNGKSVLTVFMKMILGDYADIAAPLSLITAERAGIGGVSPEVVKLKGIRYAVVNEPKKNDTINEGVMKQITSGKDALSGRAPYQPQSVTFYPQCKLVVACNILMGVKSDDHGTWRRIRAVPFKSLFTEDPKTDDVNKPYQFKIIPNIDEKFDDWKEVFLSMLVDIVYKSNGYVKDCSIVLEQSKNYRNSQNYISEFASDRLIRDKTGRLRKTELNSEFTTWFASNYGGKGPSIKDVREYVDKTFGVIKNGIWTGVRVKYEDDDDEEDNKEVVVDSDISSEDL